MFDLEAIQEALRREKCDGWLLCDFRGSNLPGRSILNLGADAIGSRRLYYFIPAAGEPCKLVHAIESGALDHLPGDRKIYARWQELESGLEQMLPDSGAIAMEYSPRNANPYISQVDGGTVELVRSFGVTVVGSGNLIQRFEATWSDRQWELHQKAEKGTIGAFDLAFTMIADGIRAGKPVTEVEVQRAILAHFDQNGMTTYHPPIVAVGPHTGDPHFEPNKGDNREVGRDNFILLDIWAKLDEVDAVYADYTKVAFTGAAVPARFEEIFGIVAAARNAAVDLVKEAFDGNREIRGCDVDDAARAVIDQAGYGDRFFHRTGHSIGCETHGNGAHMDNFEARDERRILRRTCFSVEPGIYLPEFGVRSEVNVFIDRSGAVHVTGEPQDRILSISG